MLIAMKNLILAFILGIIFGVLASSVAVRTFPSISPFTRDYMAIQTMFKIFLMNCFLATLICYGGVAFSLGELKLYKSHRVYTILDRTLDPFYFLLDKIFAGYKADHKPDGTNDTIGIYKKLGSLHRTLYFSISIFSIGCIFLIGFLISFYFWVFFMLTDIWPNLLIKSLPHLTLEVSVFFASASIAQQMSSTLREHIVQKKIEKFKAESIKLLKDKKIWRTLVILYIVLFFSAFVERFFTHFKI